MSVGERSRSEKALENILKQNNVTIVELISEPTFRSRLKSPPKILTDFLLKDQTINEMCDWLLTDEYCSLPSYKPTAQSIFRIFKDSPESLQNSFSENEKLIFRLFEFSKSQKEQPLLNCAFFEQMIEFFSLITRGGFISNFKRLPYLLAKRIELISIRHLFYFLAANFTIHFSFNFNVVLFILHNINERNKEQVMLLFSRLVKNSSSFPAFDNSKVISALLDIAKTTEHDELVFTQAFQIVENITKNTTNPDNVQELLQQFAEEFDITTRPINYGTAVALRLFKTFNPSFAISMVTNPTHMFMHAGILMSIEQLSDDVLIPFIEENNIPVKLIWAMNVAKSNGYLTKLAILLDSKKELSECLQTPEWTKFVNEQLKTRIDLLNAPPPSNLVKKKRRNTNPKPGSKMNATNAKNKNNPNEKTQENQEETNQNENNKESKQNQKQKSKESQQKKSNSNKGQISKEKNDKETDKASKNANSKSDRDKEKDKKKQKEKENKKENEKEKETKNQTESKDNTKQNEDNKHTSTTSKTTSKKSQISSSSSDDIKFNSIDIPLPLDVNETKSAPQSPVSSTLDDTKNTNNNSSPLSPPSPPRQRRPSPIPIYTKKDSALIENNPEFMKIIQGVSKCKYLDNLILSELINKQKLKEEESENKESKSDDLEEDGGKEISIENDGNLADDIELQKSRTSISPPPTNRRGMKWLNYSPARSSSQPNSKSPPSLRSPNSEVISNRNEKPKSKTETDSNSDYESKHNKSRSRSKSESEAEKSKSKSRSENDKTKSENDSKSKSGNDKSKSKNESKIKADTKQNEKSKSKQIDSDKSKSKSETDEQQQQSNDSKSNKKSKSKDKQKQVETETKSNSKTKTNENQKQKVKTDDSVDEISVVVESSSSSTSSSSNSDSEEDCDIVTVQDSTDNIVITQSKKSDDDYVEVVELADDATTIGPDIHNSRSIDDLPPNLIEFISTSQSGDVKFEEEEEDITISSTDSNTDIEATKTQQQKLIMKHDDQIIVFDNETVDDEIVKNANEENDENEQKKLNEDSKSSDDHIRLKSSPQNSTSSSSSSDILSSSDLSQLPPKDSEEYAASLLAEEIMEDEAYYRNLSSSSPMNSPIPSPSSSKQDLKEPKESDRQRKDSKRSKDSKSSSKEQKSSKKLKDKYDTTKRSKSTRNSRESTDSSSESFDSKLVPQSSTNTKNKKHKVRLPSSKRIVDLDDGFCYSSDSYDDSNDKVAVFGFSDRPTSSIAPICTRHIVLTQFGPVLIEQKGNKIDDLPSSGSDDDEYTFTFSGTPQKMQRKKTFESSGKFGNLVNSQTKKGKNQNQTKTPQTKRYLPQLS